MRRSTVRPLGLALTFGLSLAPCLGATSAGAAPALPPPHAPAAAPAGPEGGGPPFRVAPPPSALERARIEYWYRVWRREGAAVERSFSAALVAAETGGDRALRLRCVALAGALLDLDRPRVLPVPDRAADLHLRRALRHLARAAVTCLTKRPYAARHALEQAAEALAQARRVLRRYGVAPGESAQAAPP